MIIQCCVCGAIRDKNGYYDGIKRAIIRNDKNVSHGYCKKCYEAEITRIEKETSKCRG